MTSVRAIDPQLLVLDAARWLDERDRARDTAVRLEQEAQHLIDELLVLHAPIAQAGGYGCISCGLRYAVAEVPALRCPTVRLIWSLWGRS